MSEIQLKRRSFFAVLSEPCTQGHGENCKECLRFYAALVTPLSGYDTSSGAEVCKDDLEVATDNSYGMEPKDG